MGGAAAEEGDWVTFERAVRIVIPTSGGPGQGRSLIVRALETGVIEAKARTDPPQHPRMKGVEQLGKKWFQIASKKPRPDLNLQWHYWDQKYKAWREKNLLLRKAQVETIASSAYEPADTDRRRFRAAVNWSLLQTLSWIATRDLEVVLQIACREGWRAPFNAWPARSNAEQFRITFEPFATGHAQAFGWLLRTVAENHCQKAVAGDESEERWERCVCLIEYIKDLKAKLRSGLIVGSSPVGENDREALSIDWNDFSIQPATFREIGFDRAEVERLWPTSRRMSLEQIREWIRNCGLNNNRVALNTFRREHSLETITEESFKGAWRAEKGERGRGRPRKM